MQSAGRKSRSWENCVGRRGPVVGNWSVGSESVSVCQLHSHIIIICRADKWPPRVSWQCKCCAALPAAQHLYSSSSASLEECRLSRRWFIGSTAAAALEHCRISFTLCLFHCRSLSHIHIVGSISAVPLDVVPIYCSQPDLKRRSADVWQNRLMHSYLHKFKFLSAVLASSLLYH